MKRGTGPTCHQLVQTVEHQGHVLGPGQVEALGGEQVGHADADVVARDGQVVYAATGL